MKHIIRALVLVIFCATPLAAQSSQDRASARDIAAKHGGAIVTVLGGIKTHMSIGGKEMPVPDSKIQSNAVVLDGSGLTVMPLSALDAADVASSLLGSMAGEGGPKMEMTSEPSDLRIRLGDGREIQAHVVLRDKDLGLAFLRPMDALDKPVPAVDGLSAKPGVMDAVVGLRRYGEMAGWQVAASLGYVQLIVDKPRLMYVVATDASAVFDMTGNFIGLLVIKHAKPTSGTLNPFAMLGGGSAGMEGLGMMPVVLPADDIRAIARQAAAK
jgi:hypothetical protein